MLRKLVQKAMPIPVTSPPNVEGLLLRHYQLQITHRHARYDQAQVMALQKLQALMEKLLARREYESLSAVHKLLSSPPGVCQSLYIFGDVGRGKSMLMNLFYEACPISQKRRIHFFSFMQEVHGFLHQWRKQHDSDAILALAETIRASAQLLCFDEFHVTDIADAMILGRLFSKLFDLGVVVVMTSNIHPDDLYQGGLQRELFLPFIRLLQDKADTIELAAQEDYRLGRLQAMDVTYLCPLNGQTSETVWQTYQQMTDFAPIKPGVVEVFGRKVVLTAVSGAVALTTFDELCSQALGSADYLEIARVFNTLVMEGIPRITADKRNEARRFVTLIDALYEHKVKLICTADVPPHELYTEGDGSFEFKRTVSRLIEMQSKSYLLGKHIAVDEALYD
jgi:cell division protein ZapE